MDLPDLARLEHENLIEASAAVAAQADGALVRRADGVALVASGLPVRMFNQVVVEADDATPAALADAVATMRERDIPFAVSLRRGTDDRFTRLMAELGLAPVAGNPWTPGMALYPIPENDGPDPSGYRIVRAASKRDIEEHVRVGAAGYEMSEALYRAIIGVGLLRHSAFAVYTGYVKGKGVTTGVGLRTSRTIGIYDISTVPEARRRGYAAAMTRRIAADGARAGCDVAVLQATEMGLPVYENLGYRTVVEYMGYTEPA